MCRCCFPVLSCRPSSLHGSGGSGSSANGCVLFLAHSLPTPPKKITKTKPDFSHCITIIDRQIPPTNSHVVWKSQAFRKARKNLSPGNFSSYPKEKKYLKTWPSLGNCGTDSPSPAVCPAKCTLMDWIPHRRCWRRRITFHGSSGCWMFSRSMWTWSTCGCGGSSSSSGFVNPIWFPYLAGIGSGVCGLN